MSRTVVPFRKLVPGDGDCARMAPRGSLDDLVVTAQWRPSDLSRSFAFAAFDPTRLGMAIVAGFGCFATRSSTVLSTSTRAIADGFCASTVPSGRGEETRTIRGANRAERTLFAASDAFIPTKAGTETV